VFHHSAEDRSDGQEDDRDGDAKLRGSMNLCSRYFNKVRFFSINSRERAH